MKRQRLFGIGNFVENRQWIRRGLLRGLRLCAALDLASDEDSDREHHTGEDRAADEQKEDLPSVEPAGDGLGFDDVWHAAALATCVGSACHDVCCAVAVHEGSVTHEPATHANSAARQLASPIGACDAAPAMSEATLSRRSMLLALGEALLCFGCAKRSQSARPLRVAAAADVEPVFSALTEPFRQKTGREVVLSFAASGVLSRQLEHGAPFDLFVSASREHIDRLHKKGRLVPGSIREYARGQLAIWTAGDGPLPQSLTELGSSHGLRIAVANPEHAPYGQAAVAALRTLGVFDALKRRLIYAENVRQAQQFAESGNADVAIIARSLAGRSGRFVEVPIGLHPAIVQTLAVVIGGDELAASEFADQLFASDGRRLLRESGFLPPAPP